MLTVCNCQDSLKRWWESAMVITVYSCLNRPWCVPYRPLIMFPHHLCTPPIHWKCALYHCNIVVHSTTTLMQCILLQHDGSVLYYSTALYQCSLPLHYSSALYYCTIILHSATATNRFNQPRSNCLNSNNEKSLICILFCLKLELNKLRKIYEDFFSNLFRDSQECLLVTHSYLFF